MRFVLASCLVVAILLIITQAIPFVREHISADSCLDRGGSFDYEAQVCDTEHNHPYDPFTERHKKALPLVLIGAAGAASCTTWLFLNRRRNLR